MTTRREFLGRAIVGSALVALGPTVPGFVATTARAAEAGRDRVLVVVEMTGGNDGLNTVVPYADDLYHAARPTLGVGRDRVIRVDDHVGLNPGLRPFEKLLADGYLAIVQGVGYPNPDRSHFSSMDVWQSADPSGRGDGWLGRGLGSIPVAAGQVPAIYAGDQQLPLALRGSSTGVPTVHPGRPYDLDLALQAAPNFARNAPVKPPTAGPREAARRRLIAEMTDLAPGPAGLGQFARRTALQTYATIAELREVTDGSRSGGPLGFARGGQSPLRENLGLVARMIEAGFGTRVFYLSIGGFDTHAGQAEPHRQLLGQLADAVAGFFDRLGKSGHAGRVALMTFSEFGRRVRENGSGGPTTAPGRACSWPARASEGASSDPTRGSPPTSSTGATSATTPTSAGSTPPCSTAGSGARAATSWATGSSRSP